MNNNEISVEVYGNPSANGGYVPLVMANKPSFELLEPRYSGLTGNSWFIVVRIDENEVVFRLHKNRTYSYGAVRPGDLDIAFALPKGWKLDRGYTPFDVLMDLKRAFLEKCMTCKQEIGEHYEFRNDPVPDGVFDEVINKYPLKKQGSPWHVMNSSGPVGILQLDEDRMGDFLNDVQYAELERFREVVVAEKVTASGYEEIRGLIIPRNSSYSIYLDGVRSCNTNKVDNPIIVKPNANAKYYDVPVPFTISSLLNGDFYEGVRFDADRERVDIDSQKYFKPKCEIILIGFTSDEKKLQGLMKDGKLTLWYGEKELQIDKKEATFTLKGDQLGWDLSQFTLHCETNEYKFENRGYHNQNKQLQWRVTRFHPIVIKDDTENYRVVLFILRFDDDLLRIMSEASSYAIKIFKSGDERNFYTRKVIEPSFCSIDKEVLIPVACPDKQTSYEVELSVGSVIYNKYISLKNNDPKSDQKVSIDFQGTQESHPAARSSFTKSALFFIAGFLLCALLSGIGLGAKYAYDKFRSPKDSAVTGNTPNDSVVNGTENTSISDHTNLDSISKSIAAYKATLQEQNLTFAEVDDIYRMMDADRLNWKSTDTRFCSKLEDYKKIVDYIRNGEYDALCNIMDKPQKLCLANEHKLKVGYITQFGKTKSLRISARKYFNDHHGEFKSFVNLQDIEKYLYKSLRTKNKLDGSDPR